MGGIVLLIVLIVLALAAARWGADSRPRDHDRWWPIR
jgi:hypothetical protein